MNRGQLTASLFEPFELVESMESEDVRLLDSSEWTREQYEICVLVHEQAVYSVVVRMHILSFARPSLLSNPFSSWRFVSWRL